MSFSIAALSARGDNAKLSAFVVLTGHLDQPDQVLSESLFLKALSILPEPSVQEEEEEATTAAEENTHGTVLSLGFYKIVRTFLDNCVKNRDCTVTYMLPHFIRQNTLVTVR